MDNLDFEKVLNELEVDYKVIDKIENEISNLSTALDYYNTNIVNRPNEITIEYLYKLESDYKDIISLNSLYSTIAYTAYDVSLESLISTENKFARYATNVVEFIKKLARWVVSMINGMFKTFRNTRRKLINIVGKLLKSNDNIMDRLRDIQRKDLQVFKAEIDYKDIKDDIEDFVNANPGFYIGIDNFDDILNYNNDLNSINNETRYIVNVLEDNLLDTRSFLKNHSKDYDFNKLYDNLIDIKKASMGNITFLTKAKNILGKANVIDKKAKEVFITNINKNKVTIGLLFNPTNDSNDVIVVNDIDIASKEMKEFTDPISLEYIFKKIAIGLHNIDKDIAYNRDIVTDVMTSYDKTIELAELMIDKPNINNVEELKDIILFINKNIFPFIFKGYMNQYLGLVLSFNSRIKLINLIIDKIYSKTAM